MKKLVIMPGGFHPLHAGHMALYTSARRAFPDADVYVAATNDTSERPFPFAIKEKLAKLAGVEPGHFVQVKSPFQAREITQNYDPETTALIFVRSEKDRTKPPQAGGTKKDGSPAYLQPITAELNPMNKNGYMAYLPTVEFGPGMTSATEIRTAWPTLNRKRKTALVMSLYPKTQSNPELAQTVVKMLDTAIIGEETVAESNLEEIDRRGFLKGLGAAAVAGAIPLGAKAEYSSYKLTPEDIEILRHNAALIYFGMYDKIKHKGSVQMAKSILSDLKRIANPLLDFMDDVWIMGVFDKMKVENPEMYRSYYTAVNDLESSTRLHNMFQRLKDKYINGMTPEDKQKFASEMSRTHQIMTLPKESVNQGVAESKSLTKKVKIVKGPDTGKTGWIREVKHGAFKGAPKTYYVDLDDGGQANNLPGTALRLVKDNGVAEAAYPGNIGIMELAKFFDIATLEEKTRFKQLMNIDEKNKAWKLIQKVTGVKLQGKEFAEQLARPAVAESSEQAWEVSFSDAEDVIKVHASSKQEAIYKATQIAKSQGNPYPSVDWARHKEQGIVEGSENIEISDDKSMVIVSVDGKDRFMLRPAEGHKPKSYGGRAYKYWTIYDIERKKDRKNPVIGMPSKNQAIAYVKKLVRLENKSQQGVAEGSEKITWIKPNFDYEWDEIEFQAKQPQVPADVRNYMAKHFPNKPAWMKSVQHGRPVVVRPDHGQKIRNYPDNKRDLLQALSPASHDPEGPAKEKRVNDLFDKGGPIEMPIILRTEKGLWLIGGKTRLGTANLLKGIPAKVWMIGGEQGLAEGSLADAAKHVKKGALHKQEHIPLDKKIGATKLKSLKAHGTPLERKRANFALNIQGIKENAVQLSIQQLATISDAALDNAYHYGRSSPGNTFGWQANLKSAEFAKRMIDSGVTDIEKISDAIHKGWNVTAKAFVQNPEQFDDTEKLKAAGKLEAKLQQRAKLMNIEYAQLPNDEQEKDRVVAGALLQALKGEPGLTEERHVKLQKMRKLCESLDISNSEKTALIDRIAKKVKDLFNKGVYVAKQEGRELGGAVKTVANWKKSTPQQKQKALEDLTDVGQFVLSAAATALASKLILGATISSAVASPLAGPASELAKHVVEHIVSEVGIAGISAACSAMGLVYIKKVLHNVTTTSSGERWDRMQTLKQRPDYKPMAGPKPGVLPEQQNSSAVTDLEHDMKPHSNYTAIDHLMKYLAAKHHITPEQLHDKFVDKHGIIPDEWIKNKPMAEADEVADYDRSDELVRRLKDKAAASKELAAQGKKPETRLNPKTGKYRVDFNVKESGPDYLDEDPFRA